MYSDPTATIPAKLLPHLQRAACHDLSAAAERAAGNVVSDADGAIADLERAIANLKHLRDTDLEHASPAVLAQVLPGALDDLADEIADAERSGRDAARFIRIAEAGRCLYAQVVTPTAGP